MTKFLFKADELHVSIDEAIEIEPNSVFRILLKIFDDSGKLERARQWKIFEIPHEHGDIEMLGYFLIQIEGLVLDVHRLTIVVKYY